MRSMTTDRLLLRAFQKGDLDDFFAYAQNPNIGPSAGWKPHESRWESRDVLRMFIRQDNVWAVALRVSGRVIGSVGFHPDEKRPGVKVKMLGYALAQEYWGRGLMTEAAQAAVNFAFCCFPIDLLSAYHYSFNHRSRRVLEKCGFRYEGTLRLAGLLVDGAPADEACYSITRQEWENQTPPNFEKLV